MLLPLMGRIATVSSVADLKQGIWVDGDDADLAWELHKTLAFKGNLMVIQDPFQTAAAENEPSPDAKILVGFKMLDRVPGLAR